MKTYRVTVDDPNGGLVETYTVHANTVSTGSLDGMLTLHRGTDLVFVTHQNRVRAVELADPLSLADAEDVLARARANHDEDTARSAARGARNLDRR